MSEYLSVAETAKLVRKALRREFPGAKFSVRSSSYSMGASISVSWTDGPAYDAVELILSKYEGSGFDGMIDLKYNIYSWLLPDGSAVPGESSGTEGSRGVVPAFKNPKPDPDAKLVSFGADYVNGYREYSAAGEAAVREVFVGKYGRVPTDDYGDRRSLSEIRSGIFLPEPEVVKKTESPEEAAVRERKEAAKEKLANDILATLTMPNKRTGELPLVAASWFTGYKLNRSAVGGVFRSLSNRGLIRKARTYNGTTWWGAAKIDELINGAEIDTGLTKAWGVAADWYEEHGKDREAGILREIGGRIDAAKLDAEIDELFNRIEEEVAA